MDEINRTFLDYETKRLSREQHRITWQMRRYSIDLLLSLGMIDGVEWLHRSEKCYNGFLDKIKQLK